MLYVLYFGMSERTHMSLSRERGPQRLALNMSSWLEKPVDLCGTSFYTKRTAGRYLSHSVGNSVVTLAFVSDSNGIFLPLRSILDERELNVCAMKSISVKGLMVLETNWVPLSERMKPGKLILQKIDKIVSATSSAVRYFRGRLHPNENIGLR